MTYDDVWLSSCLGAQRSYLQDCLNNIHASFVQSQSAQVGYTMEEINLVLVHCALLMSAGFVGRQIGKVIVG